MLSKFYNGPRPFSYFIGDKEHSLAKKIRLLASPKPIKNEAFYPDALELLGDTTRPQGHASRMTVATRTTRRTV